MKKLSILPALMIVLLMIGCKPNTSAVSDEAPATQEGTNQTSQTASSGGHDYTFLTDQLFHYDAVNIIGKDPSENPYKNQWIDLLPDGTYKTGTSQQQANTGKWDYNNEQKILQLRPDDVDMPTSEWKVMHNNDMMVWVGTQTFGNNNTQIKLVRRTEMPQ